MKDKLIGFAIGAAIVVAALAVFGFKGTTQNGNIGHFQIHTAEHAIQSSAGSSVAKTYLVDTVTGDVWHENANNWIAIKRPRTSE